MLLVISVVLPNYLPPKGSTPPACNVAIVPLHGVLTATTGLATEELQISSDDFLAEFREKENDPSVSTIVLSVDSPGGSLAAGGEIAQAIADSSKPTVAWVRDRALSAAYRAILGADAIVASIDSDVGSIGAIFSFVDFAKQNQQQGLTYNVVSSGTFKDVASENRPFSKADRALLERDVKIMHNNFVKAVADARGLPVEHVNELDDGSSWLGETAKENGLIDVVGGMKEVQQWLEAQIGIAEFCP